MDLKLKDNSQLTLPTGYFPVEYIESSGYPNINTGFSISMYNNSTFKIDAVIEVIDNIESSPAIYNAVGSYRRVSLVCDNSITNFLAYAGTFTSSQSPASVEFSGKVHIIHTQGKITINDVTTTVPYASANASGVLNLLTQPSKTRICSFKCYTGSTLVRDYIPVISYQEGHFGEACLYDKVNGVFYYSASTGSFTANPSQGLYDTITSAYIKDCPNILGINLLRSCINLNRVRVDIGNQSGPISELYKYSSYNGFNDNYENQTKPRLVGTWTISNYWTNDELTYLQSVFDGLTISSDSNKNIETLLENDGMAVQTIDHDKPEYNQPIAESLISNGIGHTLVSDNTKYFITKDEAAAITSLPVTLFRGNTDIESFDEFKYWIGLTTITGGTSSSDLGLFGGCTALTSIKIPKGVTTIGAYSFYNDSTLNRITLPSTITTIGSYAFYGCNNITGDIVLPETLTSIGQLAFYGCHNIANLTARASSVIYNNALHNSGNGTGTLKINSIRSYSNSAVVYRYKTILIYGNTAHTSANVPIFQGTHGTIASAIEVIRVKGECQPGANYGANLILQVNQSISYNKFKFFEVMGTYSTTNTAPGLVNSNNVFATTFIAHAGYNGIAGTPTTFRASYSRFNMLYVGDGSSRANDEAVLALYLADTNWSAYSAKLATWYDYNGEYKWYYITDNLTNCTNTNPDEWPHITRGNAYETTIVADEGMTIDSVTVEMLDTDTTSPTYDTMVDITSSVYDSSTGEINIPSVTGNVVITASAS